MGIASNLSSLSPTSETPFGWRFAGGPIVARFYVLTGKQYQSFYPSIGFKS